MLPNHLQPYFQELRLPEPQSHKGQNGKLLIIGGSELFHAASKWSLDIASKIVDMVFYSSVPINNELIKEAKGQFWNGIVVPRAEVSKYLEEADCILIGPGMERSPETEHVTNDLLKKYSAKKWVIDAGALQMVDPQLLNERCVITPHHQEFFGLYRRMARSYLKPDPDYPNDLTAVIGGETFSYMTELAEKIKTNRDMPLFFEEDITHYLAEDVQNRKLKQYLLHASKGLHSSLIVLKGHQDLVFQYTGDYDRSPFEMISGGNAGMTKGGTGDVLAGLIAALYCTNDILISAVVGSYVNKIAGDSLFAKVGPYFNASDLVEEIPVTLWNLLQAHG